MCGRFTLRTPMSVLIKQFFAEGGEMLSPRYNISPSQQVLCVRERHFTMFQWGLIPSWAKEPRGFINARGDTVAVKPTFRHAFRKQRCLIVADGYYEWQTRGKSKQPYLFEFPDKRAFAFAGLWERWNDVETCAIITTEPNEFCRTIHDRMPLILRPKDYDKWMLPATEVPVLEAILKMTTEGLMARPVSTHVNSPKNDDPKCVEPLGVY